MVRNPPHEKSGPRESCGTGLRRSKTAGTQRKKAVRSRASKDDDGTTPVRQQQEARLPKRTFETSRCSRLLQEPQMQERHVPDLYRTKKDIAIYPHSSKFSVPEIFVKLLSFFVRYKSAKCLSRLENC